MTTLPEEEIVQGLQEQLKPWELYLSRNALGTLVAIKGTLGAAEQLGMPPCAGADGEALEKALVRLGYGADAWCAILTCPLGQPPLSPQDLALVVETLAPTVVIALDQEAAALYETQAALSGRPCVTLTNFEQALLSEEGKKEAWQVLRQGLA